MCVRQKSGFILEVDTVSGVGVAAATFKIIPGMFGVHSDGIFFLLFLAKPSDSQIDDIDDRACCEIFKTSSRLARV